MERKLTRKESALWDLDFAETIEKWANARLAKGYITEARYEWEMRDARLLRMGAQIALNDIELAELMKK